MANATLTSALNEIQVKELADYLTPTYDRNEMSCAVSTDVEGENLIVWVQLWYRLSEFEGAWSRSNDPDMNSMDDYLHLTREEIEDQADEIAEAVNEAALAGYLTDALIEAAEEAERNIQEDFHGFFTIVQAAGVEITEDELRAHTVIKVVPEHEGLLKAEHIIDAWEVRTGHNDDQD